MKVNGKRGVVIGLGAMLLLALGGCGSRDAVNVEGVAPSYTSKPSIEPSIEPSVEPSVEPSTASSEKSNKATASTRKKPTELSGEISQDKACQIAYKHAKVNKKDVNLAYAKRDKEDGRIEYEIKFYKGNKEYEYEIMASNGEILSHDVETIRDEVNDNKEDIDDDDDDNSEVTSKDTEAKLTKQQALRKAYQHAGVSEEEAVRVEASLEREDGKLVYEIEFQVEIIEYSYEIDAMTGKILQYEEDVDD